VCNQAIRLVPFLTKSYVMTRMTQKSTASNAWQRGKRRWHSAEAAQGLPDPVDHSTSPELRALLATLLPACIMMDAVYENVTVCLPVQPLPFVIQRMMRNACLAVACIPMSGWSAAAWAPQSLLSS